ncbi:MAG: potassium transporter Kup [Rhodospirillaceae bacterium]|nr:potassium transporter Kup [Rhodospirillales bacterium]
MPVDGDRRTSRRTANLTLVALGVVFGDIGTSPLYALRECFAHGLAPSAANVLGVLSLVIWSMVLVVAGKYIGLVLRADNRGEGGVMALMALTLRQCGDWPRLSRVVTGLGLVGAALFFGDAMITPAISVLSAVEGVQVAVPELSHWIIPLAVAILIGLFSVQSRGTARMGALFGPVMVVWFGTLAVLGLIQIVDQPAILRAVSPLYAVAFIGEAPMLAFLLLGAAVLVLTGAEAVYADMGHFNRRSITTAWFAIAMPALLLNYLGQGALLLAEPQALDNPFYRMAPDWGRVPLIVLASVATVVASQAVISGAYSIVRQASLLRYWPRMTVLHTSSHDAGQIYLPSVNWELLGAVLILVLGFRSSGNLASAYGLAVTGTMLVTTVLVMVVARTHWHWSWALCAVVGVPLLLIDLAFLTSNMLKIPAGGWLPIVTAIGFVAVMTTWRKGKRLMASHLRHEVMALEDFVAAQASDQQRVHGTAIFLASIPEIVPPALMHNLLHNGVLHERNLVVQVINETVSHVRKDQRIRHEDLGQGFYRVKLRFGFMEDFDVPGTLARFCPELLAGSPRISYFVGRETVRATRKPGMAAWRERLFMALARNAGDASIFFHLPPDRVVEIGVRVEI